MNGIWNVWSPWQCVTNNRRNLAEVTARPPSSIRSNSGMKIPVASADREKPINVILLFKSFIVVIGYIFEEGCFTVFPFVVPIVSIYIFGLVYRIDVLHNSWLLLSKTSRYDDRDIFMTCWTNKYNLSILSTSIKFWSTSNRFQLASLVKEREKKRAVVTFE